MIVGVSNTAAGSYVALRCDTCGAHSDPFWATEVGDGLSYAMPAGWTRRRDGHVSRHVCPKCRPQQVTHGAT